MLVKHTHTHTHTHTDLRGYTFCSNTTFKTHTHTHTHTFKNQKLTTMHMDVFRCTTTVSLCVVHVLDYHRTSVFCLCAISWCTHKNILYLITRELPEFISNPWRCSNICTSHSGKRQIRKYKPEYKAANKLESSVKTVTCYSDKTQCRKHQLLLYFNNAWNWPLVNFLVGNTFTPLKWTWRGNIICY